MDDEGRRDVAKGVGGEGEGCPSALGVGGVVRTSHQHLTLSSHMAAATPRQVSSNVKRLWVGRKWWGSRRRGRMAFCWDGIAVGSEGVCLPQLAQ